jgi:hypothetical protein
VSVFRHLEVRLAVEQLDIASAVRKSNAQSRASVQNYPGAVVERNCARRGGACLYQAPYRLINYPR